MSVTRRGLLRAAGGLATGGLAGCVRAGLATPAEHAPGEGRIRVVAFDAFVLFDPRPFARALDERFPGRGPELAASFRARLFDYGWLRALGERYQDFWRVSEDALDATADAEELALSASDRAGLLEQWASLPAWPDTLAGIEALERRGLELAVLSNWSPGMIDDGLARTGLAGRLRALSTDAARTYKPDPRAYGLALDAYAVGLEEVLFVAFAGWDAAGASWFGLPTVWMNRAAAAPERLELGEVALASSFADLVV